MLCFVVRRHVTNVLAALGQRFMHRIRIARRGRLQCHRQHRTGFQIHRMLRFVCKMRAAILHLRDLRIRVVRILPVVVGTLLLPLAIQLGQLLARESLDAGFLCQAFQKLFIGLPRVTPYDRAQRGIGFQRGPVYGDCVSLQ